MLLTIEIYIARHMIDIKYIVIYCSALGYFNREGEEGVILYLCRVWGPSRIAPTQRPVDVFTRNLIREDSGEYMDGTTIPGEQIPINAHGNYKEGN